MTYECNDTPTELDLSLGPEFAADHHKSFRCNGYAHIARLSVSPLSTYK